MTKRRWLFCLEVAEPLNTSTGVSFGLPGPWTGVCGLGGPWVKAPPGNPTPSGALGGMAPEQCVPGHSPHPPHPPGLCLWVPSRRGGLAKPGTAGPRAFLDRAGCLSLGNPADWPKRARRNSHWGNDRAQSPTAAARVPTHRGLHVPALRARPGRGAHCPRPPPAGIQPKPASRPGFECGIHRPHLEDLEDLFI